MLPSSMMYVTGFSIRLEIEHQLEVMCRKCMRTEYPNRDRMVLEQGTYMQNMQSCVECGAREVNNCDSSLVENEDGAEVTTYHHRCVECRHLIAVHTHTFCVDDGFQEYSMECCLCGSGSDSRSVLPDDPRHNVTLL